MHVRGDGQGRITFGERERRWCEERIISPEVCEAKRTERSSELVLSLLDIVIKGTGERMARVDRIGDGREPQT